MSKCQTDHLREHQRNVCIESLQGLSIPWHKPQNSIKPGEPAQKTSVRYLTFPFLRLSGCFTKPLIPTPHKPYRVMYKSLLQGKAKSKSKPWFQPPSQTWVRQAGRRFIFPFFFLPHRRERRTDKASRLVLTWLRHRLSAAHCLFHSKTLESPHSFIHEEKTMQAQRNLSSSPNNILNPRRRLVKKIASRRRTSPFTQLSLSFLPPHSPPPTRN